MPWYTHAHILTHARTHTRRPGGITPQTTHPHVSDEATLALECLLSTGALNAAELAQKAAASSRGLRGAAESAAAGGAGGEGVPAAALIQPAEALMWWVLAGEIILAWGLEDFSKTLAKHLRGP